ncbi:MAG: PD-(D/E)XK nuclease family protein [Candidatus Microthrix sp.]|nr:PD-(D/E)XK nuclease family protein [Candidatus Microthrix sp.]
MAFDLPTTLSPSKVATFTDCALSFRFSAVERLPEPPSIPAERGTLVHRALELLFSPRRNAPLRRQPPASTRRRSRPGTIPTCRRLASTTPAGPSFRPRRPR